MTKVVSLLGRIGINSLGDITSKSTFGNTIYVFDSVVLRRVKLRRERDFDAN